MVFLNKKKQRIKKLKFAALILLALEEIQHEKKHIYRRYWVRPFLQQRKYRGDFYIAVPDMIRDDPEFYFETFRMTPTTFEELLALVGPQITKTDYVREAISAAERLQMTLAYLVSGDQQKSIAKNYRVGRGTVCLVIRETCKFIYETLRKNYLPSPSEEQFGQIASEFNRLWQFPNCIGAIDGKHFAIPKPPNSGSTFHNYKKFFSVVMLAVCDANYNFTMINTGASGSESDAGIFRRSGFGKKIVQESLSLPPPVKLPGTNKYTPYVFVGDEAFPLLKNMMRPYPGNNLEVQQRVFNYRLSRARRIIENSFGILVARWRLLNDTIHMKPENAVLAINACVTLHNFVRANQSSRRLYCPSGFVDGEDPCTGQVLPGSWRSQVTQSRRLTRQGSNNYQNSASMVREIYTEYFNDVGAVPWQEERIIDY